MVFLKYEAVESNDKWPGLPDLGYNSMASGGLLWHIWKNSSCLIQSSGNPNPHGTLGFHILL